MYIFHICPLLDERSVQGVSPTALHSGLVSFPPRSSQLVDGRTAFQLILPLLTTSLCRTLQAPPGHPWTCPSPRRRPRSPSTGPMATLAEVPSPDSSSRPEPQVSRARERAGGGEGERFACAEWEVRSCLTLNLSVQLLCDSLRPAAQLNQQQFSNEGHRRCDTESDRLRG